VSGVVEIASATQEVFEISQLKPCGEMTYNEAKSSKKVPFDDPRRPNLEDVIPQIGATPKILSALGEFRRIAVKGLPDKNLAAIENAETEASRWISTHHGLSKRRLGDDFLDDVSFHVGQAHVPPAEAEGESRVVHAEQLEHRGVEVVHFALIFDRLVTELVGRPVNGAPFHSTAGHPQTKAERVMIAGRRSLGPNGVRPNSPVQTMSVFSSKPRS